MTTQQVAQRLVELCRNNQNVQAIDELYHRDIVSVEAVGDEQMPREMKGVAACHGKARWWYENHTVHRGEVSEPLVTASHFAVKFEFEVTQKASGQRFNMSELALYEVADGKIIREEFFYRM